MSLRSATPTPSQAPVYAGVMTHTGRGSSPSPLFQGEGFSNPLHRRGESLEAAPAGATNYRTIHSVRDSATRILDGLDVFLPDRAAPESKEGLQLLLNAVAHASSLMTGGYCSEAISILAKLDGLEVVSQMLQPVHGEPSPLSKALSDLWTQPDCGPVVSQHIASIFKKSVAYNQEAWKSAAENEQPD